MDNKEIIHMNGRIYDPTLGRFLQADPFIQSPENSQSYNRYSYMMNNPLGGTDPSGYIGKFFKSLIKAAIVGIAAYTGYLAVLQSLGTSVSIAVAGALEQSMITYASSAYIGAAAASGAIAGALNSGTLKGALTGAFSAGTFAAIGGAFSEASGFWKQGGAGHIGAHAITGGILTDLQGGKFGHGFFSAGITKGAQVSGFVPNDAVKGTIASAILGGTVSRISGGKFANGAGTGAFQFLFNNCVSGGCKSSRDESDLRGERIRGGYRRVPDSELEVNELHAQQTLAVNNGGFYVKPGSFSPVEDPETLSFLQRLGCTQDGTGQYCAVYSPVISGAANAGSLYGLGSGNPVATLGSLGVGGINYGATWCLCDMSPVSTFTGAATMLPGVYGGVASSIDMGVIAIEEIIKLEKAGEL